MRSTALLAALAGLLLLAPTDADAGKRGRATITKASKHTKAKRPAAHRTKATRSAPARSGLRGAAARISIGDTTNLRPAATVVGRREEPLTAEEDTAREIEKLLHGPLRAGVTGLFVADARTGRPLFAVNADEALNPASNVKMISTATALALLGPAFRYQTRLLGPPPVDGVVPGDVYLLGSHDPTLTVEHLEDIATAVAARGITSITGDIAVGASPTRDGVYRAMVPVQITASEPGQPPVVSLPAGTEHVSVKITAVTSRRKKRTRLTYRTETTRTAGVPHITLTIGGTLGVGGSTLHTIVTRERTATAAFALRGALRSRGVEVHGGLEIKELGDFIGDTAPTRGLPIELGRHDSVPLADIVKRVNKRSINWLADRVVMTAAALATHAEPTMQGAVEAMYTWLERQAQLPRRGVVIDTGSGLSYRTRITPIDLVAVVRSAAGFRDQGMDPELARAWLDSLSIAHRDGTLRHRARDLDTRSQLRGKTGTLSTVVALSGVLELDPDRPVVFSVVTNTDRRVATQSVRLAHDRLVALLCTYLARTSTTLAPVPVGPVPMSPSDPAPEATDGVDEAAPGGPEVQEDEALDAEAAGVTSQRAVRPGAALAAVAP